MLWTIFFCTLDKVWTHSAQYLRQSCIECVNVEDKQMFVHDADLTKKRQDTFQSRKSTCFNALLIKKKLVIKTFIALQWLRLALKTIFLRN